MRLVLLILVSLAANGATAQGSPEALLRKGVVQEEVDRNLNAAVQTYQSVAARSKEDRQVAATAVFRMAECYRKLGKTDEATAAYNRVAIEFSDQKRLADESRKQLAKLAPQPGGGAPANRAEARKRFRALLEEEIAAARAAWNFLQQQYQLGAVSELDTYDPQAMVSRVQGQLAAFDAGLFPKQPASPHTAQAEKARQDYRRSLLTAIDFARKNLEAQKTEYELGVIERGERVKAEIKLLDVELQLAAFDAGLSYTPVAGALAP